MWLPDPRDRRASKITTRIEKETRNVESRAIVVVRSFDLPAGCNPPDPVPRHRFPLAKLEWDFVLPSEEGSIQVCGEKGIIKGIYFTE